MHNSGTSNLALICPKKKVGFKLFFFFAGALRQQGASMVINLCKLKKLIGFYISYSFCLTTFFLNHQLNFILSKTLSIIVLVFHIEGCIRTNLLY